MKRIFSTSLLLLLLLMMSTSARAASSTTINAASCNLSDVQSALNSVTSSTTLVTIPAGTCAWTGNLSWTVPSGNANLTIQGQTAVNCTGTAGTSSYACTASDSTIIQDSFVSGSGQSPIILTMSGANSSFRITGLTIEGGTGNVKNDGILVLKGPSHNVRLDHIHFAVDTYTTSFSTFTGRLYGEIEGVGDHDIFDNAAPGVNTLSQGFAFSNTIGDSAGWGDGTWATPTNFGSSSFFFIEASIINGGEAEDCDTAGRFVIRYSTLTNGSTGSAMIHSHGTKSQAGRGRGCRAYEAYHNYIVGPSSPQYAVVGSAGGPSLVWGNTLASGYDDLAAVSTTRNDGSETETNTPNGWGYCGTTIKGNGVGSGWDGNDPSSSGYPCLDMLGRGQGQMLNGQNFPNALNSSASTIAWPQQMLEPIYFFENTLPNGIPEVVINQGDTTAQFNRDIYKSVSSFNGTTGTGYGALASRPSTCTPGPGGTYGTSPTGSYGVAYFATDSNSGQGELYVCTSTNTWTGIYQPYTYPHPLESGSTSNTSSTPQPPSNLSGTLVQ
jgi:hypothetical protein